GLGPGICKKWRPAGWKSSVNIAFSWRNYALIEFCIQNTIAAPSWFVKHAAFIVVLLLLFRFLVRLNKRQLPSIRGCRKLRRFRHLAAASRCFLKHCMQLD